MTRVKLKVGNKTFIGYGITRAEAIATATKLAGNHTGAISMVSERVKV